MSKLSSSLATATVLAAALALVGCSSGDEAPAARAGAARPGAAAPGASDVVAEVDGQGILASELDERAASRLLRVRQEEYEIRSQVLDELIAERLVAHAADERGVSAEELLQAEVDRKVAPLPEAQVTAIYEQHKARFGSATRTEALARIRAILGERAVSERRAAFEAELRQAARVSVSLAPPRAEVVIPAGAPALGPERAPVTIVEFTDYQCPYCHRAQGVMDQLMQRYSGKLRLVHLDFPLDGHPEAVPAARAARCAGEQGRFWDYHKDLMLHPGTLDTADLEGRAAKLELNTRKFGSCLASDRHDAAIQRELQQGSELGVTGTPAYFVNGRMLSGARPVESFVEVIDAELSSAQGG